MSRVDFAHFAAASPSAVAVVDPSGHAWSRGDLAGLAFRFARALEAAGLTAGDAVAVASPNCAEFLAVYLGAVHAGINVVPINWHLAEDELRFVVEDSGAAAIVAHGRLGAARLGTLARCTPGLRLLVSIGRAAEFIPLEKLVARRSPAPFACSVLGRVMAYTSATTGRPKAVVLPARNARTARERVIAWHASLGLAPGAAHVHLCTSMLYHSAPLEGCITALHMGHRVVLTDQPDPERVLESIEGYRVTTTFLVPAMLVRLLKLPPEVRGRYSTASLEFVVHGGASCPVDVKRAMLEWWGPIIWEAYGAAEGQGTIASPSEWLRYPGTVGRAIPGSRVKILNDLGQELAPDRVGTIYLQPHTGDRFEYKGDPERTRASYHGDFITAGDIGYMNADGYLFVCDRRDDLIVASGMNIYPAEVEHVLVQHSAVVDCAVIGMRHEIFGEVPLGIVQARHGVETGPSLSADILAFAARRLAPMKLPKRIEYVDRIPRDPNGKLQRRRLREPAAPAPGPRPPRTGRPDAR